MNEMNKMNEMNEIMGKPAFTLTRRRALAYLGAAGVGLMSAGRLMASGLPAAGRLATTAAPAAAPLYKIVYDPREAAGRAVGAHFAAAGLASVTVADDPTWLWFDDLHHHWREAGVAGLTTPAVAFALKLMAEQAGLRTVIWGRHWIGSGQTSHMVAATEPALAAWQRQAEGGAAWTEALHGMIMTAAAQPATPARFDHASGAREDGAREMVSWLLAPVFKGSV
ncbi:MAG: hypothetical protein ACEQSK_04580 [Sphingomonadaceae bacterium]